MDDAKSGAEVERDLFGREVRPLRERRGRPSYAKSEENQRFVEVRSAAGWSQDMIAMDMGIDPDTLRKHFSVELQNGAIKVKGEMLDILRQRAREGHIPSVREMIGIVDSAVPRKPKEKAPEPIGKKAARLREAQDKPNDWGSLSDRLKGAH